MKNNILIAALILGFASINVQALDILEDTAVAAGNTTANAVEGTGRVVTGRPYVDENGDTRYWGNRDGVTNPNSYRRNGYDNSGYYDNRDDGRRGLFGWRSDRRDRRNNNNN